MTPSATTDCVREQLALLLRKVLLCPCGIPLANAWDVLADALDESGEDLPWIGNGRLTADMCREAAVEWRQQKPDD